MTEQSGVRCNWPGVMGAGFRGDDS